MLTINYLIEKKVPVHRLLSPADKKALLEENKDGNISYLSLMREMFQYDHITVSDLLNGWGGVQIVKA
jgi:hypothetical protein